MPQAAQNANSHQGVMLVAVKLSEENIQENRRDTKRTPYTVI